MAVATGKAKQHRRSRLNNATPGELMRHRSSSSVTGLRGPQVDYYDFHMK